MTVGAILGQFVSLQVVWDLISSWGWTDKQKKKILNHGLNWKVVQYSMFPTW